MHCYAEQTIRNQTTQPACCIAQPPARVSAAVQVQRQLGNQAIIRAAQQHMLVLAACSQRGVLRAPAPNSQISVRSVPAVANHLTPGAKQIQRDEAPRDAGSAETAPPTAEATLAPSTPASVCTPQAFSRADFLAQPNTSDDMFGLTRLDTAQVTYPEVQLRRGRVQPTTAALPTIQSVYTGAGRFLDSGALAVFEPGDRDTCPRGRYPVRWEITAPGANRIRIGEQEHCADFQYAFDISLARYRDAVNQLATRRTSFGSLRAAKRRLERQTGVHPDNWGSVFRCLVLKTLDRDRMNWHLPRPNNFSPRSADNCEFVRSMIGEHSLPHVGQHPPSEIINGCGEA